MTDALYPKPTRALADKRRDLAPDAEAAFRAFSKAVFPAVTEHLLPENWQAMGGRFAEAAAPFASNPADQRYQALFRAIVDA